MYISDTICALATPPGVSGLAVIRISGSDAIIFADFCFRGSTKLVQSPSHSIHYGKFYHNNELIDTVTCSVFISPHSYTGENTVEIGCHGGVLVATRILDALIHVGARAAEPGEFTKRAFLNGKLDLTQVESVADIIHATSIIGSQVSARQLSGGFTRRLQTLRNQLLDVCALLELELDFSQEDLEFVPRTRLRQLLTEALIYSQTLEESHRGSEILRSGFQIGLIGYPNAGKSSVFNALIGKRRSIVSDIPGTTRDFIDEVVLWQGFSIRFFDTAGFRDATDRIEMEGIELSRSLLSECHLILVINDATLGLDHSDSLLASIAALHDNTDIVVIQNKSDLIDSTNQDYIFTSAISTQGVTVLREYIISKASESSSTVQDSLLNSRQAMLLKSVTTSLQQALATLDADISNEFITPDIRRALSDIGRITGEIWDTDVLDSIFSRFCIGK